MALRPNPELSAPQQEHVRAPKPSPVDIPDAQLVHGDVIDALAIEAKEGEQSPEPIPVEAMRSGAAVVTDPDGIIIPPNALNSDDPGKVKREKFVPGVHPRSRLTF